MALPYLYTFRAVENNPLAKNGIISTAPTVILPFREICANCRSHIKTLIDVRCTVLPIRQQRMNIHYFFFFPKFLCYIEHLEENLLEIG
jgi:hypothetical protein